MKIKKTLLTIGMCLGLLFFYKPNLNGANLISYESIYEVTINDNYDNKKLGQTYITKANGELLLDWFNNCKSWVSNQRLYVNFINSSGVGTVSDIYYSLEEKNDSSEMQFYLQVKENNQLIKRVNGKAKKNEKISVEIIDSEKKNLSFPASVLFPHEHLKLIISKIDNSKDSTIVSKKVYEGSLPENFLEITTFISDKNEKIDSNIINSDIKNSFRNVRMAYFENKSEVPSLELTAKLNSQGIVSYFQYDYPTYSLMMNLKKVSIKKIDCK